MSASLCVHCVHLSSISCHCLSLQILCIIDFWLILSHKYLRILPSSRPHLSVSCVLFCCLQSNLLFMPLLDFIVLDLSITILYPSHHLILTVLCNHDSSQTLHHASMFTPIYDEAGRGPRDQSLCIAEKHHGCMGRYAGKELLKVCMWRRAKVGEENCLVIHTNLQVRETSATIKMNQERHVRKKRYYTARITPSEIKIEFDSEEREPLAPLRPSTLR